MHKYSVSRTEEIKMISINNIFKTDPTRTLTLRKRFEADMVRRFRTIQKLIYESIVTNDCFGLLDENLIPFPTNKLRRLEAAKKGQFDFATTEAKTQSFMDWLQNQTDTEILEVTEQEGRKVTGQKAWTNTYIDSAYKQGILRAQAELSKVGIPNAQRPLDYSFFQPIHADRVGSLYTRTFESLKTVTQVMDDRVQKILIDGLTTGLSKGMAEGKNPLTIARELARDINKNGVDVIGINRARMIARTEIIRAHHVANINEYREAGLEGVIVKAEWGTAGFNVCERCKGMEGKIFTLDEIEPLIPLHPNCRCAALPYLPEFDDKKLDKEKVTKSKKKAGVVSIKGRIKKAKKRFVDKKEVEKFSEEYMKDWKDQPTEEENKSLGWYARSGYHGINKHLRGITIPESDKKDVKKDIKNIKSVLNKAPSLDKDLVAYRGMDNFGSLLKNDKDIVGSIISDKGFFSSSLDEGQAITFLPFEEGKKDTPVLLEILYPKGYKGGAMMGSEGRKEEVEFLTHSDSKYKVLSLKQEGSGDEKYKRVIVEAIE